MIRGARSSLFAFFALAGIGLNLWIFARFLEATGALEIMGFTVPGVVIGGLILALVGLASSLFLVKDVAIWALGAAPLDEWYADEETVAAIQQSGSLGESDVSQVVDGVLQSCQWRWSAPQIFVYPQDEVNVVAVGVRRSNAVILISKGILTAHSQASLEPALRFAVHRLSRGDMGFLAAMYGMIIPFTLFPARMMALLLGTSLRTSDEDTPSDTVERMMYGSLEFVLVFCGSLVAKFYARSSEVATDQLLAASDPSRIDLLRALQDDSRDRVTRHREPFTAPFTFTDRVIPWRAAFGYHRPSVTRLRSLEDPKAGQPIALGQR